MRLIFDLLDRHKKEVEPPSYLIVVVGLGLPKIAYKKIGMTPLGCISRQNEYNPRRASLLIIPAIYSEMSKFTTTE